jgi:hypothetical protein
VATQKSELEELRRIGAAPQRNSGRGKFAKGDGVLGPFCVDVKEYSKSFGLSWAVWSKIEKDARTSGNLEPALKVVLGEPGGPRMRMVVISEDMFLQMYEAWKEKYGE